MFKNAAHTLSKEQCISTTENSLLMLCKEILALYSENRKQLIHTRYMKNVHF
jgi:hypothetical protein